MEGTTNGKGSAGQTGMPCPVEGQAYPLDNARVACGGEGDSVDPMRRHEKRRDGRCHAAPHLVMQGEFVETCPAAGRRDNTTTTTPKRSPDQE
jgi:hypothetical protein